MKSKHDFDPYLPEPSGRRLWPIRSIRQLMVVVAPSGVILAVGVTMARQPLSSMMRRALGYPTASAVPPRLAMVQARGRVVPPRVFLPQPPDPLVIVAPESIDAGMVVRAPDWIDPKMVFIPSGGDWQAEQGGWPVPAPRVKGVAPRVAPEYKLVPIPDGSMPRAKQPR